MGVAMRALKEALGAQSRMRGPAMQRLQRTLNPPPAMWRLRRVLAAGRVLDSFDPNQKRDRDGKWTRGGSGTPGKRSFEQLQTHYAPLLNRLARTTRLAPYGRDSWAMDPKTGFDTRGEPGLTRPVVVGEVRHPDDPNVWIPLVFQEGWQDTTDPKGGGRGRRHIEYRHGAELRKASFKNALDYVRWIAVHHDYDRDDSAHGGRVLAVEVKPAAKKPAADMAALHLKEAGEFYDVTTAFRRSLRYVLKLEETGSNARITKDANRSRHGSELTPPATGKPARRRGPPENAPVSSKGRIKDSALEMQEDFLYPPSYAGFSTGGGGSAAALERLRWALGK